MIDCKNERLLPDVWTAVECASACYLYCVKADQPGVSFKMKKNSGDTAYFTVEPTERPDGVIEKAKITVTMNDPLSGTLFYLQATSAPVDVEIFLA